jgi:hypothetical protein
MAGYSGTPLPAKLGLKASSRFGVWAAPNDFADSLGVLPAGVTVRDATRGSATFDVIVCFSNSRAELVRVLPRAQRQLDPRGGLWICWPKRTSGIQTDLSENDIRKLGLEAGLVDNKVCAIDEIWSALRFVVRLKDRAVKPRADARRRPV